MSNVISINEIMDVVYCKTIVSTIVKYVESMPEIINCPWSPDELPSVAKLINRGNFPDYDLEIKNSKFRAYVVGDGLLSWSEILSPGEHYTVCDFNDVFEQASPELKVKLSFHLEILMNDDQPIKVR